VLAVGKAVYKSVQERKLLAKEKAESAQEFKVLMKAQTTLPVSIPTPLSTGVTSSTHHCQHRGSVGSTRESTKTALKPITAKDIVDEVTEKLGLAATYPEKERDKHDVLPSPSC
jgi:hypothetical protein